MNGENENKQARTEGPILILIAYLEEEEQLELSNTAFYDARSDGALITHYRLTYRDGKQQAHPDDARPPLVLRQDNIRFPGGNSARSGKRQIARHPIAGC